MSKIKALGAAAALLAGLAVSGVRPAKAEPDPGGCKSCSHSYDAYGNLMHTDFYYFGNPWHGGDWHEGLFGACSEWHSVYR